MKVTASVRRISVFLHDDAEEWLKEPSSRLIHCLSVISVFS